MISKFTHQITQKDFSDVREYQKTFYPITILTKVFEIRNIFFIASPLKIRFSVPVEPVETTFFNPRVESRCFNPLHSYSQSDSQKSCYEK